MAAPNFPNRTLAIMDNLEFLRATDNESVDLIAIDPPFGANETFEGAPRPPITDAERRAEFTLAASHGEAALERYRKEDKQLTRVKDDWFFRDIDPDWMKTLRDAGERVRVDLDAGDTPGNRDRTLDAMREVIEAVSACATENEAAYIAEMSVRLLECHRVLKPTGSIYIHCDDRANSYLRMLMDGIFGHENFVNEITWRRQTSNNSVKRKYGRIADTLLFYSKSGDYAWNQPYHERSEREMREYRKDEDGRLYKLDNLTTPTSNPARQFTWRGATPSASRSWKADEAGLEAMLARGEIELGRDGNAKLRGWKRYLDEMAEGQKAQSIWTDINRVGNTARERTGYSTQKPLALYRRIIRASSNPGDVVLDLFAGCATTVVAAELEGRNWLACDWAYRASTMMMRRFYQNGHQLEGMNVDVVRGAIGEHQIKFEHKGEDGGRVIGPPDLPDYPRQTEDPDDSLTPATTRRAPISTTWTGAIPKDEVKAIFIERFGPVCWGCGFPARRPNGTVNMAQLEVDHMRARNAKEGVKGDDELYNLALLCAHCNRTKGNRLTLAETRDKNAHDGALYVDTIGELVDLFEAQQFAYQKMKEYSARGAASNPDGGA